MIILLSPAKSLDFKSPAKTLFHTQAVFSKEADLIAGVLRKYSIKQLAGLMDISSELAALNYDRYQNWQSGTEINPSKQAIYAYTGDVYQGIRIQDWGAEKLDFGQKHIRILSGLYGYLRPLDLIKPYRLEMGTALKVKSSENLYAFWKKRITDEIKKELTANNSNLIINLASQEYANAVDFKKLGAKVVSPQFLDHKNGTYKMISFFAKRARGLMTSYICDHQITDENHLISFYDDGYCYNSEKSTDLKPVFTRIQQ